MCLLHLKRGNFSTRRGNSFRGFSPLPPSPLCSQALFGKSPGKVPTAAQLHMDWEGKAKPQQGCEPGHRKKAWIYPSMGQRANSSPTKQLGEKSLPTQMRTSLLETKLGKKQHFSPTDCFLHLTSCCQHRAKGCPLLIPSTRACARAMLELTKPLLGLEANKIHQHFIAFALQI